MKRRTLLSALGGGTLALAGCTSRPNPGTGTPTRTPTDPTTPRSTPLPEPCPTSQELGVEWPTTLDVDSVEAFVEAYEAVYYREVVVAYEQESQVDSYELSGSVREVTTAGEGWTISYSGSGGVYRPTLWLSATTETPPDDADVVSMAEIDDSVLVDLLEAAADTGDAERHIEPPGSTVDEYIDRLASLSDDFEPLPEPGDSDSLYVDVDGTPVALTAQADRFHGDYWWTARYYVDANVVWRTDHEDGNPRNGDLLECRHSS